MLEFIQTHFPFREENRQHLVVIGLSGGVDSAVSAALLQAQGYKVVGLFMKNWEEKDDSGLCTSARDFADVIEVCDVLKIPYYAVEFVQEYWDEVFKLFLRDYQAGLTPNPDVLCNREIKFKAFYERAKKLGARYLATGHYAQTHEGKLIKGADPNKDQSYFLYTVKEEVLRNVLFPIGGLKKSEVRDLAKYFGLPVHDKKDSTGICFIGERKFRTFLNQYIESTKGQFKTLAKEVVGQHVGVPFYTLGQRKGLGLGGAGAPWFVVAKDPKTNTVYVERGDDHPALYAQKLWAQDLEWVEKDFSPQVGMQLKAKIRYRQVEQDCQITSLSAEGDRIEVDFLIPQRAITPGQSVVFYLGEVCLGGGVIHQVGESLYAQKSAQLTTPFTTKDHLDLSPNQVF